MVLTLTATLLIARPWEELPTLRPDERPDQLRSLSVDFDTVVDPTTNWRAIDDRLDQVGATAVDLNAGRVEFTAFDWDEHPDAAAQPGFDHIKRAASALSQTADGAPRPIALIVDAYVPSWIEEEPEVAGVSVDGARSPYQASASQLAEGEVGDRLVDYVAALGARYEPSQIAVTELFLNRYTFGDEDFALFREMTGEQDWPRTPDGQIDEEGATLTAWRAEVLAGLMGRMRAALDEVDGGRGAQIELAMDVRLDWENPAVGSLGSGHDYSVLLEAVDRLVLWAYVYETRDPAEIEEVTAGLEAAGLDMSRFTISVGLWVRGPGGDVEEAITPARLVDSVRAAQTHGITSVNVTPLRLMSDAAWSALASVWAPEAEDAGSD